jgi:FKBP-type peptidyl-prolyl cis-trans isomerase
MKPWNRPAARVLAVLSTASLVSLAGCPAKQQEAAAPAMASDEDKAFYSLGYIVMKRTTEFDLDEQEKALVNAGAADAIAGKEPAVDVTAYQQQLAGIFRERQARGAESEKLASQGWIDQLAAEPGAVKTPSGLVFIEVAAGSGDHPQPTDTVRVHYHGTLRDGTVFDSSTERGEPAVFPLNRVIPCWTEALQRMSPGGKARVVCPASLAYGDGGRPPHIKPGTALHFDVELLEIVK